MSSIYYKGQKYTGPTLNLGSGSLTTDNKTIVGAINELESGKDEKPTIVDTGVNYAFSSANTWEYTGLSLTIPAYSEVSLHFANIFANVPPTGIAITNSATNAPSTTSDNQWKLYAYSDTAPRVYVSGIMPTQITLHVWAKASLTGSPNSIHVWGTIRAYSS